MGFIHHSGPAYLLAFYRQPIREPLHWPPDPRGLRRPCLIGEAHFHRGFFVSCREGGRWWGFFVLRGKKSQPPPSSVQSSTHPSGPKTEYGDSSIFGSENRRLQMEWFFDLRLRRSEMGGLRSSAPKNEERKGVLRGIPPFFEEPSLLRRILPSSKNLPLLFSFFGSEDPRTSPSSIFRAEGWVEDLRGPRGGKPMGEQSERLSMPCCLSQAQDVENLLLKPKTKAAKHKAEERKIIPHPTLLSKS